MIRCVIRSEDNEPGEPAGYWKTVIGWCRRLHATIKRFSASRAGVFVLYFVIFWITAAAAQSGFIGKWGLREDNPQQKFSIQRILDGTASEPWAYRQLVPLIVNFADKFTPTPIRDRILHSEFNPSTVFVNAPLAADPQYGYRYILIYYINFFALLLSLFVLNRILVDWGMQEGTALVAPIIFVLATPFLQTKGGYFYDSTELFFFSAAFWLAMQGRIGLLILLTIPATLNKETFLIFLPTLYPILRRLTPARGALTGVGAAMGLSVAIDLTLKAIFASSPGSTVRFKLIRQLTHYLTPSSYFQTELTYGVVGPRRLSIFTIAFVVLVVVRGWMSCSPALKQHILIAAAINLPMFLLFAGSGELRNLSLLYVGSVFLLGYALTGTGSVLATRVQPDNSPRKADSSAG